MRNKVYSGIIGLVVGDALGVPVEFNRRGKYTVTDMIGYGTHNQPPGTWSDDSSLTLATVESIVNNKGKVDLEAIMNRFAKWLNHGWCTPYGEVFDVGNITANAIRRYCNGYSVFKCGRNDTLANGNGALMRILPLAMFPSNFTKEENLLKVAHLTHAHSISDYACMLYSLVVDGLMNDLHKFDAVRSAIEIMQLRFNKYEFLDLFKRLPKVHDLNLSEIKSSGYVVDTLEAALWCFWNTDSYRDCVLAAVNLGDDTDTVAAVAGGLAGIYYGCGGETGIPLDWIVKIPRRDWIEDLCDEFAKLIF